MPLVERTTRPEPPTATYSAPVHTMSLSGNVVLDVLAIQLTPPSVDDRIVPPSPTTVIVAPTITARRSAAVTPDARAVQLVPSGEVSGVRLLPSAIQPPPSHCTSLRPAVAGLVRAVQLSPSGLVKMADAGLLVKPGTLTSSVGEAPMAVLYETLLPRVQVRPSLEKNTPLLAAICDRATNWPSGANHSTSIRPLLDDGCTP